MNKVELIVNNELGKISVNYEEIEQLLADKLKEYKSAIFTEESIDIAKKEKASLSKLKKELSDRRIAVKKEYMKPIDDFENQIKKLSSMIDEPINEIGLQLEDFERKRIINKKNDIESTYNSIIGSLGDFLPLEKIHNPRWENATYKLAEIKKEIQSVVDDTAAAIGTITAMNSECLTQALDNYKRTLNLIDTINFVNAYEKQKQEIIQKEKERQEAKQEQERLAEIERIKVEERKRVFEENVIREKAIQEANSVEPAQIEPEVVTESVDDTDFSTLPFETPSTKTVEYRITALPSEIEDLERIMNSEGICFIKREVN